MGNRTAVKERKSQAAAAEAPSCRHHWLIDSPQGALSKGRCKVCGEEREFRNSTNDYIWDDDSSSPGYGAWKGTPAKAAVIEDDEMTAASEPGRGKVALAF